jgi:uncharacterized protein YdcH (DUF465 family)
MNQNDQEFQQFVCQQLQDLSDKHNELDERITAAAKLSTTAAPGP